MADFVKWESASNALKREDKEKSEAKAALEPSKKNEVKLQLVSHLDAKWSIAQKSKQMIENIFLRAQRARRREYDVTTLAALKQMFGPEYDPVFAPLIETKCSAAESWIKEIYFQKGEAPFEVRKTPIPELPRSIKALAEKSVRAQLLQKQESEIASGAPIVTDVELQTKELMPQAIDKVSKILDELADKSAAHMQTKIEDMFTEGGWEKALNDGVYDIVTFGTMIMKGPFIRRESVRMRDFDEVTGRWVTKIEQRLKEYWCRVNPFDFYPLPGTTNPQNGDFIEIIRMTRKDLSDLIGVQGWDEKEIRAVLDAYRTGGYLEWKTADSERQRLEQKDSSDIHEDDGIDCIEFHGSAPGSMLHEWGMSKEDIPDAQKEYDIVCWKIGPHIIKAMINPDPVGARPYYTAGFREIPDSFWHVGVPQLAEGAQKLCNAVFRSIAINVALASGPQIEVDIERLAPGEEFRMWPYRVWKSTNQQLKDGKAVEFFQPQIVVGPLMEVFELCLKMADEDTGVPRYAHGDPNTAGAGETASGLQMLMSQSAKGIKMVVRNIDTGVVAASVQFAYHHIMQYEQDIDVIGDLKCVATGSYAHMAREQQAIRRTEFLVQTANQFDMQVLGVAGRAELIRQALKSLDIDPDKIIKTEEELNALSQQLEAGGGGVPPQNAAGATAGEPPPPPGMSATPPELTEGAPPPAPAVLDAAGSPVAGRDNQMFESVPGVTP